MQSIYDNIALKKFEEQGEKPFRVNQIYQALYKDLVEDLSECSTISAKLRDALKEEFTQHVLTVSHVTTSANGQTTIYKRGKLQNYFPYIHFIGQNVWIRHYYMLYL